MERLLDVKNLSFRYDDESPLIFENINFNIDKKDVLCILGPNGTGKTTLLKCLNGIHKANTGEVLVKGQNIQTMSFKEISQNIGYIPQGHIPTFPFTVRDVVIMGRAPYVNLTDAPKEEDIKIAEKALKTLDIEYLKDKPYTNISGGERQLVFLARVIAQEPDILILDEPTSHLDFGNQFKLLNIIKKLASTGLSVVMSLHNPDHVFIACTKVAIMKDKRFMAFGTPEEVVTEENIKKAYDVNNVKLIELEDNRKLCVPF
jgi:iron complex transport system ATP-binding protein